MRRFTIYLIGPTLTAAFMLAFWCTNVGSRGWYESRSILHLAVLLPLLQVAITALLERNLDGGIKSMYYYRLDFVLYLLMVVVANILVP